MTGNLVPGEKDFGFGAKADESDTEIETPVAENPSKKVKKQVAKLVASSMTMMILKAPQAAAN